MVDYRQSTQHSRERAQPKLVKNNLDHKDVGLLKFWVQARPFYLSNPSHHEVSCFPPPLNIFMDFLTDL